MKGRCPRCDRELHAHIYIDAKETALYCPYCNLTIVPPREIPDYPTYNTRRR